MQPPLEQPLRGRPNGPIYVTLVESTLFDGTKQEGSRFSMISTFLLSNFNTIYTKNSYAIMDTKLSPFCSMESAV